MENLKIIDWSKELWLGLLFLCVGFTVWPLMVYFLGQAIGFDYFTEMSLRVWAEQKVYGPLADGGLRTLSRLSFLSFPYISCFFIRFVLGRVSSERS